MHRHRRIMPVAGLIGLAALGVAACGSSSSSSSGSSGSSSGGPQATIQSLSGVSTTVDVDPSTAQVLQQNHVNVATVGSATASMQGGTLAVSFPITAGYVAIFPQDQLPFVRGILTHSGGLTFSAGDKSLTATDFIVNPGNSTLTASVGGKAVQILDLDGSKVQISNDSSGNVHLDGTVAKLSSDAAAALNQTFGVTLFKQGIPLGVVHIVAAGSAGTAGGSAPQAQIEQLRGMQTAVDVDPSTAAVLAQNKVSVSTVGNASAASSGSAVTLSFPITAGYVGIYPSDSLPFIRGVLTHSGGIKFTAGDKSLTATDFIVNAASSTLTATVGGKAVKLLDLDGSKVQVTKDGSGDVHLDGTVAKLSSDAAAALNQTFGVTVFSAGIPIGVVHITAASA